MESLVDLLPLLFVGLYYLLAARRRARVRKEAAERVEAPQTELVHDDDRAATPFESFLERLEETMAEAADIDEDDRIGVPEPPPPAEVVLPAPAVPLPASSFGPSEFHAVEGSFGGPRPVDHQAHGFGPENPFSEETFERSTGSASRDASPKPPYDPHGLHARRPPPPGGPGWRRRLRDPRTAREAFVLQTIFGPRGGIHGDRRDGKRR